MCNLQKIQKNKSLKLVFKLVFFSLILTASMLLISCGNKNMDLIKDYQKEISSDADAKALFLQWLGQETNFNPKTNKIQSITQEGKDYQITLLSGIIINERKNKPGLLGYVDYKLTSDGKIYGYSSKID